jgi:hypothetical protein
MGDDPMNYRNCVFAVVALTRPPSDTSSADTLLRFHVLRLMNLEATRATTSVIEAHTRTITNDWKPVSSDQYSITEYRSASGRFYAREWFASNPPAALEFYSDGLWTLMSTPTRSTLSRSNRISALLSVDTLYFRVAGVPICAIEPTPSLPIDRLHESLKASLHPGVTYATRAVALPGDTAVICLGFDTRVPTLPLTHIIIGREIGRSLDVTVTQYEPDEIIGCIPERIVRRAYSHDSNGQEYLVSELTLGITDVVISTKSDAVDVPLPVSSTRVLMHCNDWRSTAPMPRTTQEEFVETLLECAANRVLTQPKPWTVVNVVASNLIPGVSFASAFAVTIAISRYLRRRRSHQDG